MEEIFESLNLRSLTSSSSVLPWVWFLHCEKLSFQLLTSFSSDQLVSRSITCSTLQTHLLHASSLFWRGSSTFCPPLIFPVTRGSHWVMAILLFWQMLFSLMVPSSWKARPCPPPFQPLSSGASGEPVRSALPARSQEWQTVTLLPT